MLKKIKYNSSNRSTMGIKGAIRNNSRMVSIFFIAILTVTLGGLDIINRNQDRQNFEYMRNALEPTRRSFGEQFSGMSDESFCTKHAPRSFDAKLSYSCSVSYRFDSPVKNQEEIYADVDRTFDILSKNAQIYDVTTINKYPRFLDAADLTDGGASNLENRKQASATFKLKNITMNWCSLNYTAAPLSVDGVSNLSFDMTCTTPTKTTYLDSVQVE